MRKNCRRFFSSLLLCTALGLALTLTGCGEKDAEVETGLELPEETPEPEPEEEEEEDVIDLTGLEVNSLTGLYIDETAAARRPIAVVINNLRQALPQSGLGQADIYYEVLAEGGITRIIAVFRDFDSEKIGPIRSTRHYFLDFALENDAVFVHHGGSPQGYSDIGSTGINNLDGMQLDGSTFWRDPVRRAQAGMYEHSSYTDAEGLLSVMEDKGFRVEAYTDAVGLFDFFEEDTPLAGGEEALRVVVPFSGSQKGEFEYDEETGEYLRFQNGNEHIDEETGEQLRVKNILIQQTTIYVVDDVGRSEVKTVGSGEGFLVSEGTVVPVYWERTSRNGQTLWTDENGDRLTVNKGKTWICVLQNTVEPEFEGTPEPEEDEMEEGAEGPTDGNNEIAE